jgi:hypothetical protein
MAHKTRTEHILSIGDLLRYLRGNMRRLLMITWSICISGIVAASHTQANQISNEYTIDEVIAAYEAGQFRVIYTRGEWLAVSPDGAYIRAVGDGIYRVSDGMLFEQFDGGPFSPDGVYVIENYDGVYRLSDKVEIVDTPNAATSEMVFSDNGAYVAVGEDGVYRLSDGQQIVDTVSSRIEFSPDSSLVATSDGIFRLNDGQKLLDMNSDYHQPTFSPDGAYAWSDGVYRLSDGKRLFDVISSHGVSFTPDMNYAVILEDGVYRLSDGQRLYTLNEQLPYMSGPPSYSRNGEYMAIADMGVYRIPNGEKLLSIEDGYLAPRLAIFSPDSSLVAIENDGVYRLSDGYRLFEISDSLCDENFSGDSAYLAADYVYRVADGYKLFDKDCYRVTFSPDAEYVAIYGDGLYRLSDQQKLFDIVGTVRSFSQNGAYINVGYQDGEESIYRVRDGYQYRGLYLLDVPAGIMAIGNTALVVDLTQRGQRLPVVRIDADWTELYKGPGDDNGFSRIRGERYLVVLDTAEEWYQVNVRGESGWLAPTVGASFYLPD